MEDRLLFAWFELIVVLSLMSWSWTWRKMHCAGQVGEENPCVLNCGGGRGFQKLVVDGVCLFLLELACQGLVTNLREF